MPAPSAPAIPTRFRGWELRPLERTLLVNGAVADIGSRAFDVLVALVERQGRVVSKAELLDAAWPGLVVEENNVSVQVATLRKLLGPQAIATVAGIGYRLAAAPDAEDAPPAAAPRPAAAPAPTTLPPVPALLGRDADVQVLLEHLATARLVTLCGTGGVGKTSLARVLVARRVVPRGEDAWWIDLAPLRDAGLFVPLVAGSLGVELEDASDGRSSLMAALGQVNGLIALDNCEHLMDEVAAFVAQALACAPGVRWLATSQEPLHLAGEVVYRLGPLDVPPPDAALAEAARSGAVALLCERAAAADRHFCLSDANLAMAIDLCRQLDGLPLAIEMAAARVALMGLPAVHGQLGQHLRSWGGARGSPARHHTLRSTFDWSHGLLSSAEQAMFRRLEPFLGGFTAAMAVEVAADLRPTDALDPALALEALGALVDKSLVHRRPEAPDRFHLFESARAYAAQKLDEAGETEALQDRHARVVGRCVADASSDLARLRDDEWSATYVPERHNVRAALAWTCRGDDADTLARLVAALALIDSFVQSPAEIVQCELPMDVLERAAPPQRAAAWLELSWAHYTDGSREVGTGFALRALTDFRALGDVAGEYRSLGQLTRLYESRPSTLAQARDTWALLEAIDPAAVPLRWRLTCDIAAGLQYGRERTPARLQELEEIARRAGFDALAAVCRSRLTDELLVEHRYDEVVALAQQFLDAGESRPRVKGLILLNQALALVQLGRSREARDPARAALRTLPSALYLVAGAFALAAAREGRLREAAMLTGYEERIRRERDEQPDPAEADAIAETAATLRDGLAPERLAELKQVGAALAPSALLAVAMP